MIKIREMISEDRDSILKILHGAGMFTSPEIDVALELIDIFLNDPKQRDYVIRVAENTSGKPVGYVCYGPAPATEGTYDIYWIAVDVELQKKGIGKRLLSFAEEQIVKNSGRQIIIETSSLEKYHLTREFYSKNGYSIEAKIRDYYSVGDDRVIFIKKLN